MWKLPDGRVLSHPKSVRIDGVLHPAAIFTRWSKEELARIGIKPYREERPDEAHYRATGWEEVDVAGEIVKRPVGTEPKFTIEELKARKKEELDRQTDAALSRTDKFVIRSQDPTSGKWLPNKVRDERKAIRDRNEAEEAKLNALKTYEEVVAFKPKLEEETVDAIDTQEA